MLPYASTAVTVLRDGPVGPIYFRIGDRRHPYYYKFAPPRLLSVRADRVLFRSYVLTSTEVLEVLEALRYLVGYPFYEQLYSYLESLLV